MQQTVGHVRIMTQLEAKSIIITWAWICCWQKSMRMRRPQCVDFGVIKTIISSNKSSEFNSDKGKKKQI